MQSLVTEIRNLTLALAGLRSDNIIIENIESLLEKLRGSDIAQKLAGYKNSLPGRPEEKQMLEKHNEAMKAQADVLNKEADRFLDELERIKTMRHTLNLEALDPVIMEARRIIHSIHGFSAGLQEE